MKSEYDDTIYDGKGRPQGEATVLPFNSSGKPLADPFSIFENPEVAKKEVLSIPDNVKLFEETGRIHLDHNLVVNNGRQILANAVTGRDYDGTLAVQPWTVSKCSWGSFNEVPRFTDTSLSPQAGGPFTGGENEIIINTDQGNYKKAIDSVDYPQDFVFRFELVLEENEANGITLREMALWSQNETLFARKSILPINKEQEFGLSFLWRVRV